VRELPGVLRTALRLLARHWPGLLCLAFLGVAARTGVLWLAVHVSAGHHVWGQLILILGPPGFMLGVVGMFYVCKPSLPRLVELGEVPSTELPSERRPARLIDLAASVLVPFMALYEGYGLLDDDVVRFRNAAAVDELGRVFSGQHHIDLAGRLGIYGVTGALGIVGGAWVVRWLLGLGERVLHLAALAYLGVVADIAYTAQLAGQTVVARTQGAQWVRDRNAAHWVGSTYDAIADAVGVLAGPFRAVVDFMAGASASWNEVVLVPLAWIGLGAVVLARKQADEEEEAAQERGDHPKPDPRTPRLPVRVVRSLVRDVGKRLSALWEALRLMVSAGLVPMLALSLLVLVVIRLPYAVLFPVAHVVAGPMRTATYLAFSPLLDSLVLAVSFTLAVPLVAAMVDWLVAQRLTKESLQADLDRRTGAPDGSTSAAPLPQGAASST
jgi:hypothetical protein